MWRNMKRKGLFNYSLAIWTQLYIMIIANWCKSKQQLIEMEYFHQKNQWNKITQANSQEERVQILHYKKPCPDHNKPTSKYSTNTRRTDELVSLC